MSDEEPEEHATTSQHGNTSREGSITSEDSRSEVSEGGSKIITFNHDKSTQRYTCSETEASESGEELESPTHKKQGPDTKSPHSSEGYDPLTPLKRVNAQKAAKTKGHKPKQTTHSRGKHGKHGKSSASTAGSEHDTSNTIELKIDSKHDEYEQENTPIKTTQPYIVENPKTKKADKGKTPRRKQPSARRDLNSDLLELDVDPQDDDLDIDKDHDNGDSGTTARSVTKTNKKGNTAHGGRGPNHQANGRVRLKKGRTHPRNKKQRSHPGYPTGQPQQPRVESIRLIIPSCLTMNLSMQRNVKPREKRKPQDRCLFTHNGKQS